MSFTTCRLQKMWLHKCLKNRISEDPSSSNMVNGPKHCGNLKDSTIAIFIDHVKAIELGKLSVSDTQNRQTVC